MAAFPGRWAAGTLLPQGNPKLADALNTWHSAAAGRAFPPASALGPAQLKAVLPDVHIYTVSPDAPRYHIRLVGTRMTDRIGQNLAGKPVDEIANETLRRAISGLLGAVETAQTWLHLMAPRAVALPDGEYKALESIWLPCADDGRTIDRVIAISLLSSMVF